MPEPRGGDADAELRDHLLASAVDFRQMCATTLEGYRIENGETVWDYLSHRVDALLDGDAVTISRFELPDFHPESPKYGGDPGDRFTLDPDDVLRPAPGAARVMPNRAAWRAMGQRGHNNASSP